MKKRALPLLLALTLCLVLTLAACGGSGNTPTSPQSTPSSSQAEPSASTPEVSEPEPSEPECEHVWTEANYQEAKTCTVCGETEGDPLPSAFTEKEYMVVGTAYDHNTICVLDPSKSSTGKVTINDYKIIDSDETHEAKEGYEWRIANISFEMGDTNAMTYGPMIRQIYVDYYTGEAVDWYTDKELYAESDDDIFAVNYYGETYECRGTLETLEEGFGSVFKYTYITSHLVPVGYDGCVLVFHSAEHEGDHDNFTETIDFPAVLNDPDTLYFRLD